MKILIATKNTAKIEGVTKAFELYFDDLVVGGINIPSKVSEQPVNDEIYLGAKNRAEGLVEYAKQNNMDCDYFCAIESGISNSLGEWIIVNVAVIIDKNGKTSFGTSAGFPVPNKYVDKIISTNLGEVMDEMFKQNNLRVGKGGVHFLTNGKVSRADLTKDAFIMALTKFINECWSD